MIARIVTTVMCVTILTGCASQTLQLPISTNDPANPNASESAFSPRPNLLQSEMPVTAEQPVAEPTSPAYPPITPPTIIYTCPMHPEIVQSSLGRCSKCGMRLVPAELSKTEPEGRQ
ncbi:MAG TPA: heavy metal-binding domain-containing protein [Candidatus Brocadiia bacterium]|nr:heavy metal-binding domain-containing protein [Candidatus Brocadiales bacterium]